MPDTEVKPNADAGQVDLPVRPLLEGETVHAPQTAELYVLLVRYGGAHWASLSSHPTPHDASVAAENQAQYLTRGDAWRIVRVRGLPLHVPAGEAA